MTKVQIDSVSGATPKTGTQNFIWDGTDSNGITVPSGDSIAERSMIDNVMVQVFR